MKKALSFLLCFVLTVALIPSTQADAYGTASPVIYLCGFTESDLYDDSGIVFPPEIDKFGVDDVVKIIPSVLLGLVTGRFEWMTQQLRTLLPTLLTEFNYSRINSDGTESHPLHVLTRNPTSCRSRGCDYALQKIAKNCVNGYHYVFETDFRKSIMDTADELKLFVDEVKKQTGYSKVSLFGYSQGGSLAAAYLTKYGSCNDLDRVVFVNSPVYGTKSVTAALSIKDLNISATALLKIGRSVGVDIGFYNALSDLIDTRFLNPALEAVGEEFLYPTMMYWCGLWDMAPLEDYETLKNTYLDKTKQAWLIEKSDAFHYDVMAKLDDTVVKARANGVQVSFLCGTDCRLVASDIYNGDSVVDVNGCCHAYSPLYQKGLPNNYEAKGTVCNNPNHQHISPDRKIDASTCALPENTWFVIGQGHCQYDKDENTMALLTHLFTDDTIKDIYSDSRFPQFTYGSAPSNALGVQFGSLSIGSYSANDTQIILKNYGK
ncbi:MAG TPA: hypothetical protein DDY98_04175, partial [Ruminococcaceae bacterium]|nr:hypothetical protein [Oscillospiraceae bacterium]